MPGPIIILIAVVVWGFLHSVFASLTAKTHVRQWFGSRTADGLYRLLYNIVAVIAFLPVMALVSILPDVPLYQLPRWALVITAPVQVLAAFMALIILWRVDLPRFLGLRQLARWLEGRPDPRGPPVLVTSGIYSLVRHPLYFFSLVILWLTPVMTVNILTFNTVSTLYFWIGSFYEERKLVAEFGEAYRLHQQQVPRLYPWPKRKGV